MHARASFKADREKMPGEAANLAMQSKPEPNNQGCSCERFEQPTFLWLIKPTSNYQVKVVVVT